MDLFLNLWNILKNFLIYIFVRYLSYSLLKIHRKLSSGYLLCDKATLSLHIHYPSVMWPWPLLLILILLCDFRFPFYVHSGDDRPWPFSTPHGRRGSPNRQRTGGLPTRRTGPSGTRAVPVPEFAREFPGLVRVPARRRRPSHGQSAEGPVQTDVDPFQLEEEAWKFACSSLKLARGWENFFQSKRKWTDIRLTIRTGSTIQYEVEQSHVWRKISIQSNPSQTCMFTRDAWRDFFSNIYFTVDFVPWPCLPGSGAERLNDCLFAFYSIPSAFSYNLIFKLFIVLYVKPFYYQEECEVLCWKELCYIQRVFSCWIMYFYAVFWRMCRSLISCLKKEGELKWVALALTDGVWFISSLKAGTNWRMLISALSNNFAEHHSSMIKWMLYAPAK
jgi:hypothetical protein